MEKQTKIDFFLLVGLILLSAAAIIVSFVAFSPLGGVLMGLLIIAVAIAPKEQK